MLREQIRKKFMKEDVSPEVVGTSDSSMLRDLLVDEFEAVTIYQKYVDTITDPDIKSVLESIRDEEKVHIGELLEILQRTDPTGFEQYVQEGGQEVSEIVENYMHNTVTEATDQSFTIQYREDGEEKYSSVTANSESAAISKFSQIAKAQGRNVQSVQIAVTDVDLAEAVAESMDEQEVDVVSDLATKLLSAESDEERSALISAYLSEPDANVRETITSMLVDGETSMTQVAEYLADVLKQDLQQSEESIEEGVEEDPEVADQEFSSAATSINSTKLPALFKMVDFRDGSLNLDYGGGRFDNVADYLSSTFGATNLVYDPYNRSSEHNQAVLDQVRKNSGADTVTCSNVLNVVKEPAARMAVIRNCKRYLKSGGTAYFTVYEGDGSGEGSPTKAGYQLNKKTADYVEEIAEVFPSVQRKGKLIIAK